MVLVRRNQTMSNATGGGLQLRPPRPHAGLATLHEAVALDSSAATSAPCSATDRQPSPVTLLPSEPRRGRPQYRATWHDEGSSPSALDPSHSAAAIVLHSPHADAASPRQDATEAAAPEAQRGHTLSRPSARRLAGGHRAHHRLRAVLRVTAAVSAPIAGETGFSAASAVHPPPLVAANARPASTSRYRRGVQ